MRRFSTPPGPDLSRLPLRRSMRTRRFYDRNKVVRFLTFPSNQKPVAANLNAKKPAMSKTPSKSKDKTVRRLSRKKRMRHYQAHAKEQRQPSTTVRPLRSRGLLDDADCSDERIWLAW